MSDSKTPPSRFQPPATELTGPFWEATKQGDYFVQWCTACDTPVHYPREACPECLEATSLEWRTSSGEATVYAHSVQYRPAWPGLADRVPYVVALVDLDAGSTDGRTVRIMTNLVDVDPDSVSNGDPVVLAWEPLDGGRNLAVFRPAH